MKQMIKEIGMTFCCKLMGFICWLKGFTGNKISGWRWKIFLFLDWCEILPNRLFGFFYTGSREEIRAALTLEYGEELNHYNLFQQSLIKAIYGV